MGFIDVAGCALYPGEGGPTAPVIYVVDAPEHPFATEPLARVRACNVVTLPVCAWGNALTPWPSPGLYREEPPFGGRADETLSELLDRAIPAVEEVHALTPSARALCGYSLGGLFALYAFVQGDAFVACACLSGSVWYDGWLAWLRAAELDLSGRFAYLSLGTKEKRGPIPRMRTVQADMEACAEALRDSGCQVTYQLGPGNHFQLVSERLACGLDALDTALAERQGAKGTA